MVGWVVMVLQDGSNGQCEHREVNGNRFQCH